MSRHAGRPNGAAPWRWCRACPHYLNRVYPHGFGGMAGRERGAIGKGNPPALKVLGDALPVYGRRRGRSVPS